MGTYPRFVGVLVLGVQAILSGCGGQSSPNENREISTTNSK